MLERQVGELPLHRKQCLIPPSREHELRAVERHRILGKGPRVAAVEVARELVQHDHQCEQRIGLLAPALALAQRGARVQGEEAAADLLVEGGVLAKPRFARLAVSGRSRLAEPECEDFAGRVFGGRSHWRKAGSACEFRFRSTPLRGLCRRVPGAWNLGRPPRACRKVALSFPALERHAAGKESATFLHLRPTTVPRPCPFVHSPVIDHRGNTHNVSGLNYASCATCRLTRRKWQDHPRPSPVAGRKAWEGIDPLSGRMSF